MNPLFGVLGRRHTFIQLLFASIHCPSRSSDSAQGKMLPESPGGDCMSLQPYSSSCIILAVATQPTSNTQNTQFSPNSPNCQPSMGIWEPLANKLEHSYEIWCKAYTITAAVCKYLPSLPVHRHAAPYRVSPGQVLSWGRYTGIFD